MKIDKSLEDSSLLIKAVKKTIKNETKKQEDGFLITCIECFFIKKSVNRQKS